MKLPSLNSKTYIQFINNIKNQKYFLVKVFFTLLMEILLTFITVFYAISKNIKISSFASMIIFILSFASLYLASFLKSVSMKLINVCVFCILQGLSLSHYVCLNFGVQKTNPLYINKSSPTYATGSNDKSQTQSQSQSQSQSQTETLSKSESIELIKKTLMTTISIFIFFILFGVFLTSFGLQVPLWLSVFLFLSLLFLIIGIFILSVSNASQKYHKYIIGISLFIFSIFIVTDTMNILNNIYNGDFVAASISYFLDFINIFVDIGNYNN